MFCAIVAFIGCVLQAASEGHLVALYFGRFIAGLGTGGASMMAPVYISENSPRAIRGAVTGLYQLFVATGIMLSYWINVGFNLLPEIAWRANVCSSTAVCFTSRAMPNGV